MTPRRTSRLTPRHTRYAQTASCCTPIPPRLFPWRNAIFFSRLHMTIVEKITRAADIGSEYDGYRRDTMTLTWQHRRQGHGRRHSDGGLEFAISIPNGTVLKGG